MEYIIQLLPVLPVILAITAIAYLIIFKLNKDRRERPSKAKMSAEFTLIGWIALFLYVTQILSFGNGFGEPLNLTPLRPFYIAMKYGSNNAGMVTQILLNVMMFVPLGFLLPVAFPKRFKSFRSIFIVSFSATFITELLQLLSGRSADIDDIIANTTGGLLGFSFYVILVGILSRIGKMNINGMNRYWSKLCLSILTAIIFIAPFIAVKITDSRSEFGTIYYGHMRAENVVFVGSVINNESQANVYQYYESESMDELRDKLQTATGFTGTYHDNQLPDGENGRIFIYDHNRWSVVYNYGIENEVAPSKLPEESEAVELAYVYLEPFEVFRDEITFTGVADNYVDGNLHLLFSSAEQSNTDFVWGDIIVSIGENGELLDISDNRVRGRFYRRVDTIAPLAAIGIAQDVSVGEWAGTAYVHSIEMSYHFNENTEFLIPVWRIQASFISDGGDRYDWSPYIDAIK